MTCGRQLVSAATVRVAIQKFPGGSLSKRNTGMVRDLLKAGAPVDSLNGLISRNIPLCAPLIKINQRCQKAVKLHFMSPLTTTE